MPICLPCKGGDDGAGAATENGLTNSSSNVCVRCFTFWLLVVLLALGLMAHYHDSQGNVHLG